jgi:BirA family biotin operon repressor/biotin-[acetyl-CoA-carboxylase] ligase
MNFILHHYPTIGSTNDEAKKLMEDGAPEGTVVWADIQTAGRGRQGRRWVSDQGNLYASVLLRPSCSVQEVSQLSFVAALAVGETIVPYLKKPDELYYKWPNDLILRDSKVSGILLEANSQFGEKVEECIIGIGLNITSAPTQAAYPTTRLQDHAVHEVNMEKLFSECLQNIDFYYHFWKEKKFLILRNKWLTRAYRLCKDISVKVGESEIQGQFLGLGMDGSLMLKEKDGEVLNLNSAEVF